MLLDWLGRTRGPEVLSAAARDIERAVGVALAEGGKLTPDLGGKAGTTQLTEAIIAAL
jgi:isocitrate/isopropylmalate dehydrogenase